MNSSRASSSPTCSSRAIKLSTPKSNRSSILACGFRKLDQAKAWRGAYLFGERLLATSPRRSSGNNAHPARVKCPYRNLTSARHVRATASMHSCRARGARVTRAPRSVGYHETVASISTPRRGAAQTVSDASASSRHRPSRAHASRSRAHASRSRAHASPAVPANRGAIAPVRPERTPVRPPSPMKLPRVSLRRRSTARPRSSATLLPARRRRKPT